MKVGIVGAGYVGLTAGVGLASLGHDVICADIDEETVSAINAGDCPLFEDQLPERLEDMVRTGRIRATTAPAEAVHETDITMFAVGTPSRDDGSIDLSALQEAVRPAAAALHDKNSYHVFAIKSTVVPGTAETVRDTIAETAGKIPGEDFGICANPEFLREGTALPDFLEPPMIVIGEDDERAGDAVARLYSDVDAPIHRTSVRAAEMIKYAENCLEAVKISFINEIGNLCKDLGIDVYEVADGVGLDSRVTRTYLDAGAGFGGSCLPKDTRALVGRGAEEGEEQTLVEQAVATNMQQKVRLVTQLEASLGDLDGKKIAVLGLAFKPGTDDIRHSPAIAIIDRLKQGGSDVHAYDPAAMENMKTVHPNIVYHDTRQDALRGADAALLVTDWPEFDEISLKEMSVMANQMLLEGRRVDHDLPEAVREGICWP